MAPHIIRILVILVPGFVACKIYRKMRGRTAKKVWEDYAEICAFAIASYTILVLFGIRSTIDNFLDSESTIEWTEILMATFIAVILALFASFLHQTRILNKVGWKIGVTTLQTDEEIWEIFHEETGEWVFVRDLKHNVVYFGYILMYSRSDQYRELWLRDVEVFSNDSGNKLYEVDEVYVCANKTELTVEIPKGTSAESSVQKTKEKENGSKKSSQGCKTDDKEDQANSI